MWCSVSSIVSRCLVVVVVVGVLGSAAWAEERAARIAENRAALIDYFGQRIGQINDAPLSDLTSLEAWEAEREQTRQQLAYMLGLDPMPEATPLEAEVTGTIEHDAFTVEKVHFQSLPGVYVTANLYVPRELDEAAPTVLYLCGHAQRVRDGVSLGNKTAYQHHPAWFAQHGYVAMIVDTIQLGEIRGLHHGTHRQGMWWWNARGYTPAGVEAFNAMRAIDYLETRDEVDVERIGVTGRSGGGIGTLYLAALDERVAVAAPVAGITDLRNHVHDHLTPRHCDCNYFPNVYGFDYDRIVALIAPRPLLIANTDKDPIFPLDGVQRYHRQVAHVYDLYDASDRVGLAIAEGGHGDSQPLRVPVFSWFNRHLKDADPLIDRPAEQWIDEAELRVFDELPGDEIVTEVHHHFVAAAEVDTPGSVEEWEQQREAFGEQLAAKTFRNWGDASQPEGEEVFVAEAAGVELHAVEFSPQEHVSLRVYAAVPAEGEVEGIFLRVLDEADWELFLAAASTVFADELGEELAMYPDVRPDGEHAERIRETIEQTRHAYVFLPPRGVGLSRWAEADSADATHLRRSFPILGQTVDGQRVFDVLRGLDLVRAHPDAAGLPVTLRSSRAMAGVALYAAVHDQDVAGVELAGLPASHHEGPEFLNVLRFMDVPQAVAMAVEHGRVRLTDTPEPAAFDYAREVADLLERSEQLHIQ